MEIRANELRIGNIVEMACDGKTFTTKIDVGDFMDINRGYKSVNGIKLTEEILLKCGFEKHHPEGNLYSLSWTLTSLSDGKKIDKNFSVALFDNFFVVCQCQNTHLKYLHELQNLFYFTSQNQEFNISGL